jgi:outer membrane immunogenic protein
MFSIRTFGATAGASLLALVVGTGMSAAADLSNYEPPPPAPVYTPAAAYSWTGPYVGLTGGYGWGSASTDGWLGGAYAGYNFQTTNNWVIGLEGDFTFAGKEGTVAGTTYKNPWNSTVRGRLGYAFDRYLLYGTGGVAFGKLETENPAASDTKTGWTAGAGVEVAFTQNITGRLEYRHTDLGDIPGTTNDYHSDDIMVGVGFKF